MTEEEHALAILKAIQAAEAAGFQVEIAPAFGSGHVLSVGSVYLVEPTAEDEPWDMWAAS